MHSRSSLMIIVAAAGLLGLPGVAHAAEPNSNEGRSTPRESETSNDSRTIPFGFDLLPFVGTSSGSPWAVRNVSFNLIGGLTGGIDGAEFGGSFNITGGDVTGAQMAGGANVVTEDLRGFQAAGGANVVGGALDGVQLAGAANVVAGRVSPLQGAGALNLAADGLSGAQLAGAANVSGGPTEGLQLAGAANVLGGPLTGVQLSGAANVTGGSIDGAQIGVANVTNGDVDGLQLGVANVAEDSTASVGVVSILFDGFTDLELFGSTEGLVMASIRHGGDNVFNVYSLGSYLGPGGPLAATGLGIGLREVFSPAVEFSTDISGYTLYPSDFFDRTPATLVKLRPLLAWRPSPDFAAFAGPTLSLQTVDADADIGSVAPFEAWEWRVGGDTRLLLWPGLTAGLRFL